MSKITRIVFLFLSVCNLAMSMDQGTGYPQLQLETRKSQKEIFGKLMISHHEMYHPHILEPVEYLSTKARKIRPSLENSTLPLNTPFIRAIIIEDKTGKVFKVRIPAPQLLHCNDGSSISIYHPGQTFQVTCSKNSNNLNINEEYYLKNRKPRTFQEQFLSCMNQFYMKQNYCSCNINIPELIKNQILRENEIVTLGLLLLTSKTYEHGQNGCKSEKDLINLAKKREIQPYGNAFDYVMNRHAGIKGKRKPALSSIDLNNILDSCLEEMEQQNQTALNDSRDAESILEECLDIYEAINQVPIQPGNEYGNHNHCTLL